MIRTRRSALLAGCVALAFAAAAAPGLTPAFAADAPALTGSGVVMVKSAYGMDETIRRLKADIADKKLMFFYEVDQAALAAAEGIEVRPSVLLNFGNPALGTLFVQARAEAGLDWPVRLLVSQDESGQVWASYTDFAWIARRHRIDNREAEFAKASEVIASITAAVAAP
ncbi:MAG: DUF302 domain-containing protein [Paracoccaceae bacterium]